MTQEVTTRPCPKCNDEIPYNATLCGKCWTKVTPLESPPLESATKKAETSQESHSTILKEKDYSHAIINRYDDAYVVAKITIAYGSVIKRLGIGAAVVIALVGFLMVGVKGDAAFFSLGIILIAISLVVGISIYLGGLIVSAQGQMLRASLDSAVGGSPFLTREQKAKTMGVS